MNRAVRTFTLFGFILLLCGCDSNKIKPKSLREYKGWIIVDKFDSAWYNVTIENLKTGEVLSIDTYKYYWDHYNLGDTIK